MSQFVHEFFLSFLLFRGWGFGWGWGETILPKSEVQVVHEKFSSSVGGRGASYLKLNSPSPEEEDSQLGPSVCAWPSAIWHAILFHKIGETIMKRSTTKFLYSLPWCSGQAQTPDFGCGWRDHPQWIHPDDVPLGYHRYIHVTRLIHLDCTHTCHLSWVHINIAHPFSVCFLLTTKDCAALPCTLNRENQWTHYNYRPSGCTQPNNFHYNTPSYSLPVLKLM